MSTDNSTRQRARSARNLSPIKLQRLAEELSCVNGIELGGGLDALRLAFTQQSRIRTTEMCLKPA